MSSHNGNAFHITSRRNKKRINPTKLIYSNLNIDPLLTPDNLTIQAMSRISPIYSKKNAETIFVVFLCEIFPNSHFSILAVLNASIMRLAFYRLFFK